MNRKYKDIFEIKLFILLIVIFFPALGFCAEDLNPKVNRFANSQQSGNNGRMFLSNLDSDTVELRLRESLDKMGFIYQKSKAMKMGAFRRLRFDRNNQIIDVCLFALENKGTRIIVTHYLASDTVLDVKDGANYIRKPSVELPKYNYDNKSQAKIEKSFMGVNKEINYSDFQVPVHPKGELLKNAAPSSLVGDGGIGVMYLINDSPKSVEDFYRSALRREGFEEVKDKNFKMMEIKRIRFERRDAALELYLTPTEGETCNIIIVKYADRNGISKAEAEPLAFASFPEKDNFGGVDLEDIPRPSGSVRLSGGTPKDMVNFSYTLPLSVSQARDFYLKQMPSAGWTLVQEVNLRDTDALYAKEHRGKPLVASIPIGTKLDLGEIIKNSCVLDFRSESATVNLIIYTNFLDSKSGSILEVTYEIAKN